MAPAPPSFFPPQALPQLLHFLGVDGGDAHAADFATLAVFTCAASCSLAAPPAAAAAGLEGEIEGGGGGGGGYAEEFVWAQPPPA